MLKRVWFVMKVRGGVGKGEGLSCLINGLRKICFCEIGDLGFGGSVRFK